MDFEYAKDLLEETLDDIVNKLDSKDIAINLETAYEDDDEREYYIYTIDISKEKNNGKN